MFNFTKEMAKTLRRFRVNANLSQKEVANRMGGKTKYGQSLIAQIEMGKVSNPSLRTILDYLRACGASWVEFFKELDRIDFKLRHEKMISQVLLPPSERKIQRDAMRYEVNVEFPSKEKEEIDIERLRKQIGNRVLVLLSKNQVAEKEIPSYQKFSLEYFDFMATLNKAGMKMVMDKYQRMRLQLNLLYKIKKIINSVLRGEIKRIEAKKPLLTEKQEKMAIGFTKYRIRIEKLEAEVHRLLCDLAVPTSWFALYKAFARECYKTLKKYYGINQELFNKRLTEIIERWKKEGLKEDIILKIKDRIIAVF
jgi:transcriptional regulator with XRE-family HTH domain